MFWLITTIVLGILCLYLFLAWAVTDLKLEEQEQMTEGSEQTLAHCRVNMAALAEEYRLYKESVRQTEVERVSPGLVTTEME